MHKLISLAAASLFAANLAFAQATPAAPATPATPAAPAATGCEGKAMGKDGKPLHGAAKSAFMKKCAADGGGMGSGPNAGCEAKAVSKDGKPLHGAAKNASMKKCQSDAAAAK